MKIEILEAIAYEIVKQMPKKTYKRLAAVPEEKQAEIIGQIYEIAEDFIKKEFIKYTIASIKGRANEEE